MKYITYKENKKHGTFDFPIEFYHVTPSHPRYEMAYHWHMEYEIIRILSGTFLMTIDEREFYVKKGDIVFIEGGLLHGGIPDQCVYECIVFDLQAIFRQDILCRKQIQTVLNQSIKINYLFSGEQHVLHNQVDSLFDAMRMRKNGYELVVIGHFYQFFGNVFKHEFYSISSSKLKKNSKRIGQLKNALTLIETSYSSCITLDDLSKAANMNSKYFCRFFQEMTHRTPIDYLNYYRIECACFELVTSDLSVTEIALNCGFNDISYFIRTFKKYKGLTPKKYLSNPF